MNTTVESSPRPHRFNVDEYHRLGELGFLPEHGVELIEGEIIDMAPIGDKHVRVVNKLNDLLVRRRPEDYEVSVQNPVRLADLTEPQPDFTVLRPRAQEGLPRPKDIALLIEVSDTTAKHDREVKVPQYAKEDIPEVWLFDLEERVVEVYREPSADGYRDKQTYGLGDRVKSLLLPHVEIDLTAHFSSYLRKVERALPTLDEREKEAGSDREMER